MLLTFSWALFISAHVDNISWWRTTESIVERLEDGGDDFELRLLYKRVLVTPLHKTNIPECRKLILSDIRRFPRSLFIILFIRKCIWFKTLQNAPLSATFNNVRIAQKGIFEIDDCKTWKHTRRKFFLIYKKLCSLMRKGNTAQTDVLFCWGSWTIVPTMYVWHSCCSLVFGAGAKKSVKFRPVTWKVQNKIVQFSFIRLSR